MSTTNTPTPAKLLSLEVEERIRISDLAPKSEKALANVIEACNFLATQQIEINIAAVAQITDGKVGGPKAQSIRNNKNLTTYIKARRAEQGGTRSRDNIKQAPVRTGNSAIDAYIQTLEAELHQVRTELRDLRKVMPQLGNYDIKKALEEGILTLVTPETPTLSTELAQAIKAVLNPERLQAVGLRLTPTGQVISDEHLQQTYLTKNEVTALISYETNKTQL